MTLGWTKQSGTGAATRWLAIAVIGVVPLVVGCSKEVPYSEPPAATAGDQQDAPTGDDQAASDSPVDPARDAQPFGSAEEVPTPEDFAAEDSAATPVEPPQSPPSGLPWETNEKDDAAPTGSPDLFAKVDQESKSGSPAATKPAEKADEGPDDFESFLAEAYGDKTVDKTTEDPEPQVTAEEADASPDDTATLAKGAGDSAGDWWNSATPTPPTVKLPTDTPAATASLPEIDLPAPKSPSTTEQADSSLLDELWGDDTEEDATAEEGPAEEGLAAIEPQEPAESPGLDAAEPAVSTAPEAQEPAPSIFDEPSEPVASIEAPAVEKAPPPEPRDPAPPTLMPEPLPEPRIASAKRSAPMASAATSPLPAVPVLSFNTRHLAWLLGGKLGLAELADLDGATPSEVALWRSEVVRIAKELKIKDPLPQGEPVSDPAERVRRLMDAAANASSQLRKEYGVDHAALVEVALKTNALLVVAKDRPDLAEPVATAVREAADRAMLPHFLWEDAVRVLSSDPTVEETQKAVVRLHERVESFLR